MKKLIAVLSARWDRTSITNKFSLAFGGLFILILLLTAGSSTAINLIRYESENVILTSMQIQRLVLRMDAGLERAKQLQRGFFLEYPRSGFSTARNDYAIPASMQIAEVVELSTELKRLIDSAQVSEALAKSDIDLNLYLAATQRYADTFFESVNLVTALANEDDGAEGNLANSANSLGEMLQRYGSDEWIDLYQQMRLHEKDYLLTHQRSAMQSALNLAAQLQQKISASALEAPKKQLLLEQLANYLGHAEQIVELHAAIQAKFNDFSLQAETIEPISKKLVDLAEAEVERARAKVNRFNNLALGALGALAAMGILLAGIMANLLHRTITLNIVELTKMAAQVEAGQPTLSTHLTSQDELGTLAHTFESMTARLQGAYTTLQASESRYRALFDNSPISLWVIDPTGFNQHLSGLSVGEIAVWEDYFNAHQEALNTSLEKIEIIEVNRATLDLLKFDTQEALQASLGVVLGARLHPLPPRTLAALAARSPLFEGEMILTTSFGDEIYVNAYLNQMPDDGDRRTRILVAMTDITERKWAEEALRENEERYRALFEANNDAVFILGLDGIHQAANQRATDLLGYSVEELIGMSVEQIVDPDETTKSIDKLSKLRNGLTLPLYERVFKRKDGSTVTVEINAALVHDAAGRPHHIQSIARDITERKRAEAVILSLNAQLEKRVEERTRQLEAANQELEAFSYSISHDLRAPLRAIDGFSNILQEEHAAQMSPGAIELLNLVILNTRHMGDLIEGLLQFSRLSRQPLNKTTVNPLELVQQALKILNTEQAGRQVDLVIGTLPPCQGDPVLLLQVWVNLLSNALKFTRPRAAARIEVGTLINELGKTIFFVRDNGVGFDMRYADKLFGVFQRLHRSDEFEGTGIGLSLIKRIITRHGGNIWAASQLNVGTTFYFTFAA